MLRPGGERGIIGRRHAEFGFLKKLRFLVFFLNVGWNGASEKYFICGKSEKIGK